VIRWSRVPLRTLAIGFGVSFAAFVVSCTLIATVSAAISKSVLLTDVVIAVAGVSLIAFPIFGVELAKALSRRHRRS
jgi:hypothetical protein